LKLRQRLKNLFGKKNIDKSSQTDRELLPSDPNFDIHAWLRRSQELDEQYPDRLNPCVPGPRALRLGFSDCVTPEQKAEQERRWAEMLRQEEEAKRAQSASNRRAS